ncbi:MAG: virulence RhuM family protein [Ardenticatenaceae bacterium]|nr:virulence RhuM family protein [Ardenticatenaceae bacterium]
MDGNQNSQLILYQTEGGETQIQVIMQDETVWLTQKEMAELFQRDQSVISRHVNNVFKEGELDEGSNMQKMHIANSDKPVASYNLDVIISVGYRVKSHRGTQFRIWATGTLREYLVKGFVLNDERLEGNERNYFDELVERVRRIRTSEKQFYRKVLDIFATSIDYDTKTAQAQEFFAAVQNKFHYAIHGRTAAELITERINSQSPAMGLTNWSGKVVTAKDARIAKNYLQEIELKRLDLLVEQFLAYAELQAVEKRPMYMQQWVNKLDDFLRFNEKEILQHKGKVSRQDMEAKVREELQRYHGQQRQLEAGHE